MTSYYICWFSLFFFLFFCFKENVLDGQQVLLGSFVLQSLMRSLLLVPWTSSSSQGSLDCYSPSLSPSGSFYGHCSKDLSSHSASLLTYSGEKVSKAPHRVSLSSTWIKNLSHMYSRNLITCWCPAMVSTQQMLEWFKPPLRSRAYDQGTSSIFLRRFCSLSLLD